MKRAAANYAVLNIIRPENFDRHTERDFFMPGDGFEIRFSSSPLSPIETDIYVVHISRLSRIIDRENRDGPPVLSWGPPELLPAAFELGCSDYLKEPWSSEEFGIRCSRLLPGMRIPFPWGTISLSGFDIHCGKRSALLTSPERKVLRILFRYLNQPVHRESIHYALWGELRPGSRAVDMHISSLRKKFRFIAHCELNPHPIRTLHGTGYTIHTL